MKILVYRYGSICEPDVIQAFQSLGLTVLEEKTEITNKRLSSADRLLLAEAYLKTEQLLFVFSINFYPVLAEICHIYQTRYLCWTVDSPVPELFAKSLCHHTNHIFLFDRASTSTSLPITRKASATCRWLPAHSGSTESFQLSPVLTGVLILGIFPS